MTSPDVDRPTYAQVAAQLSYCPVTGVITALVTTGRRKAGKRAGRPHGAHRSLMVLGREYREHHIAWILQTGEWPQHRIDHFDGNGHNNVFTNLREAPGGMNNQNQRVPQSRNVTGYLGVTPRHGKFAAQITVGGRTQYLGLADSPAVAHEIYLAAKRVLHPGCTI